METIETSKLVDLEEDLFSTVLRYALYLGAIFQMACIGACIFMPNVLGSDHVIPDKVESNQEPSLQNAPRRPLHRNRKQEKKKRR